MEGLALVKKHQAATMGLIFCTTKETRPPRTVRAEGPILKPGNWGRREAQKVNALKPSALRILCGNKMCGGFLLNTHLDLFGALLGDFHWSVVVWLRELWQFQIG